MKRKKKGSTMVIAITVFFMLITLGTVLLSATSYGYRNQISQNQRVQNLYGSESGLDITYNVLAKAVEAAIFASDNAVEQSFNSTGGILETERQNVSDYMRDPSEYNKNKMLYFEAGTTGSKLFKLDGSKIIINQEELNKAQDATFRKNFCVFMSRNLDDYITNGKYVKNLVKEALQETVDSAIGGTKEILYLTFKEPTTRSTTTAVFDTFKYDIEPNFHVEVPKYDTTDKVTAYPKTIKVNVVSQFYSGIEDEIKPSTSSSLETKPGTQERRIAVDYMVNVPEYNPASVIKKVEIINLPIFNRSFAAEKNIFLAGDIEIDGNVYAKGESSSIDGGTINDPIVFQKYNGGVTVESLNSNVTKLKIDGEVVTTKSFSLRDNTQLNMSGNLYASNLHLGKYRDAIASNNQIANNIRINDDKTSNAMNVYLKNDLSIYATQVRANINNFYGLNYIKEDNGENKEVKSSQSSSILINSTTGVNLSIANEAYIMGTAYINTQNGYQTGESIAIKGNYKAYSTSLEGEYIDGKEANGTYTDLKFEYDNPLQLVTSMNGESKLNVFHKAQYFEDYANANKDKLNKDVIVNLPVNTISTGAYINGDKVNGTTEGIVDKLAGPVVLKQNEFANKVYGFDVIDMSGKFNTVKDNEIRSIVTEIDLSKLVDKKEISTIYNYDVIFNKDETKEVIVVGNGIPKATIDSLKADSSKIVYDCSNSGELGGFKGVILSASDVKILGDIDYVGTIITAGNIICNEEYSKKIFTYDNEVVKRVVAIYYDELEKVMINPNDSFKEIVELEWTTSRKHNVKEYIEQGTWSIEK